MKKALAVLLSVLMLVSLIAPTFAYADNEMQLVVTVDKTSVTRGGSFTVTVSASTNPGFNMFGASLALETGMSQDGNLTYGAIGRGTPGKNAMIEADSGDITETGVLFTATVNVADDAAYKDYTVTIDSVEVYDQFVNDVSSAVTPVTVSVVSCVHANTEQVPAEAATCVDPGHEAGTKCKDCDDWVEGGAEIPVDPTAHVWGETTYDNVFDDVYYHTYVVTASHTCTLNSEHTEQETSKASVSTVDPTCVAEGKTTYTATFPTYSFATWTQEETLKKDPDNHAGEDVQVEKIPATCVAPGYQAGIKCSACGDYKSGGDLIPVDPTAHVYGDPTYIPNWYIYVYSVAEETYKQISIEEAANYTPEEKIFSSVSTDVYADCTLCDVTGAWIDFYYTGTITPATTTYPTTTAKGETTYTAVFDEQYFPGAVNQTLTLADIPMLEAAEVEETAEGRTVSFNKAGGQAINFTVKDPTGALVRESVVITDKDGNRVAVSDEDYTYENGAFTLKESFLKNLEDGKYTITFQVGDKGVNASFDVETPATTPATSETAANANTGKKSPDGGDNVTSLIIWSFVALVSVAGVVVTGKKIKKSSAK
ncbi:MAG: hypothetical protein J6Z79_00485 [Clostridia bacterium]|nr:hypothetical protein [Clostridia bacterium]